ncbi:MAG TPA: sugar ABC transporter ATP-binding protein [Solirubrobacteraceae bacterium]
MTLPSPDAALSVRGMSKTFPGQRALIDVDFDIAPGEVRGLVGQNGSGKSTIIKILAGYHQPDSGAEAMVAGTPLALGNPTAAVAAGLRFVHQDLALVPALDALDNLALGRGYERTHAGTISWKREAEAASSLLAELGYNIDLRRPTSRLTASERTGIAIARALQGWEGEAHVLFLDEPTASLPAGEVQRLFEVVREVKRRGVAVVYISHHFGEVFELCDQVTVLRDGRVVATRPVRDLDEPQLIELTVGRSISGRDIPKRVEQPRTVAAFLTVRGLRGKVVDGVDLEVASGEVVGIAGITGSGREEFVPLLFGGIPRKGKVEIDGKALEPGRPDLSVSRGMALLPSDRLANGLMADMTVKENLTLGSLSDFITRLGLRTSAERSDVARWLDRLDVVPRRPDAVIARLSGGNQQKVMLGRSLRLKPRLLLLDDPTQGVDVGAKAAIHDLIDGIVSDGTAVLVASTESAELIRLCDRILVLSRGRLRETCFARETTPDELTEMTLRGDSAVA